MRRQTLVAVMAILETDPSITNEQSDLISEVLNGRLKSTELKTPNPILPPKQASKDYMSVKEAAKYITVSSRSIDNYRSCGDLPFHKVGERVILKKSDLDAFMEKKRIDVAEHINRMRAR